MTAMIRDVGGDGRSAYQVALDNGFEGTEAEWLASLEGGQQVDLSWAASGQYVAGEIITLGELATAFEIDADLAVVKCDGASTAGQVVLFYIGGEVVADVLVGGTLVASATFTGGVKTAVVDLETASWAAGALRLVLPDPADVTLSDIRGVFSGQRVAG